MAAKRKVYVIGPQKSYAGWMEGELTRNMEEAHLVVLTGGEDINPALYHQRPGKYTSFNQSRDEFEVSELTEALKLQIPIWGTCRGAQLLCATAGARLVQHLNHPSHHNLRFFDGERITTTSCHHQLQFPYSLNRDDYEVLAWAEGLSNVYLDGNDGPMILPSDDNGLSIEPELVYYRKLNALGIQGHPEWMAHNSTLVEVLRRYLDFMTDGTLDIMVRLKIPTERFMSSKFSLSREELDRYNTLVKPDTVSLTS